MKFNRLLIPLTIIILICLFFNQVFFGRLPLPTDLIVGAYYPWLDYKWGNAVGVPVKNSNLTDAVSIFYPLRSYAFELIKKGEMPFWNPFMFGGYPLLASSTSNLFFPTILFYFIFSTPLAWTIQCASQIFMSLIFMYILMRHWRLGKIASLFASVAYSFSGFSMMWLELNGPVATSAFLPLLIYLSEKLVSSRKNKWGIFLSIAFACQIFSGYTPVIIFSLFALLLWFLVIVRSFWAGFRLLGFISIGVSLSAVFLLPNFELFQISQRRMETIEGAAIFLPAQYLIALLAPDFFGNPATNNFWGRGNYTYITIYTGLVSLIMALGASLIDRGKKQVVFLIILLISVLAIILSNPLSAKLYSLGLWGGDSMALNRAAFLINFAIATLAGFGVNCFSLKNKKVFFKISLAIICIILGIGLGLLICKWQLADQLSWLNIPLRNLILPLLLSFLVLLIIIFNKFARFLLLLLLVMELFRFGLKFNTFSLPGYLYPKTPVTDYLRQFKHERFLSETVILPPNMWLPYNLESIAGYDSIYPLRMAKLISVINSQNADAPPQGKSGLVTSLNSKIIDLTGTKFLVALKDHVPAQFQNPGYKKVMEDKSVAVFENINSLPRAYLTTRVLKVSDDQALEAMIDPLFRSKNMGLTYDFELNPNQDGEDIIPVEYQRIANNHIQIQANPRVDSFLVILDSFYPGWKAFIDKKEVKIHRTNYAFKGIRAPAGKHVIDLYFRPDSLKYGLVISLAAAVLLVFLGLFKLKSSDKK